MLDGPVQHTWVGSFLNPSKVIINTIYVCDAATMRRIQEGFRIPRSNSAINPKSQTLMVNGCTERNPLHSPKQGIQL